MFTLAQIQDIISKCREGLCPEIDLGSLFARNEKAHKWKVTYRTIVLRELVAWRFMDILSQSTLLDERELYIGSRILIRSAIETLAILLFCTKKMENIVRTGEGFEQFSDKTTNLLLGSRRPDDRKKSINILEVIEFVSKKYPELRRAYDDLSETVHPNLDGLSLSYSTVHDKGMLTKFSVENTKWFANSQLALLSLLLVIFDVEYNESWPAAFEKFEAWIDSKDDCLEVW